MLHKTRGIVINYIRFRETSIIVKIFTEKFGIQSFIENGARSTKGKNKIALFQPLSLLEMVVYHDEKKDLHRISEIKSAHPYKTLPYHILKSSIALFLDEMMNKCLIEQIENAELYHFIEQSFIYLDESSGSFENFHLQFLLNFSYYLGFAPQDVKEIRSQLKEFHFDYQLNSQEEAWMQQFIQDSRYGISIPAINRTSRNKLLDTILQFYKLHIEDFGTIHSIQVLAEVLN